MLEKIHFESKNQTDLNMYQCGMEDCKPGHSWGPAVRDHFLVHYVLNGKGTFQVNGKIYHLEKNQGFLICPGVISQYKADMENPWSYSWVGFHGLKAEYYLKQANLSIENPVFTYDKDDFLKNCLNEMIKSKELSRGREVKLVGLLYLFLHKLILNNENPPVPDRNTNAKEAYIRKAIEYIEMNYASKLTISEISNYLGLDRSYFYSIFKYYFNMSPQEFLIDFRIKKACDLMHNNALSIGDVARSVGYEDPLLFSKVFKKVKGMSPRAFRKQKIQNYL